MMKRVSVIIVAAGEGERFGSPKQFSKLKGKPVLDWTLSAFEAHEAVSEIVLVLQQGDGERLFQKRYKKIRAEVKGGKRRQDSVLNGFSQIGSSEEGIVLVHDGVRPLVREDLISRVIQAASENGAAIPALPVKDTIKEVVEGRVIRTLYRHRLFKVQTPQGFYYSILKQALDRAREEGYYGTDEASLVERIGKEVFVIQGDPVNIKITYPEDMKIAEAYLED